MSWLNSILPGIKKRPREKREKGGVPAEVWTKCLMCSVAIYAQELEDKLWVCGACGHHHRINAESRARIFFDSEAPRDEIAADIQSVDLLKFRDDKGYDKRLAAARGNDPSREALRVYRGQLRGRAVVAAIFDFTFMGGSMGSVVGERFARGVEEAARLGCPFVSFSASGGARMQEGMASLLQMAKTTAALARFSRSQLPYVSVLTDPTTGGVAASFALIADVVVAEPNALIGFAGPRVIQETVREKLPEGFQRSEFLRQQGGVDLIWHRHQLRDNLATLLSLLHSSEP